MSKKMREGFLKYLKETACERGTFKMASGQTSDLMIDLSKTLRTKMGRYWLAGAVEDILPYQFIYGGPVCGSDLVCNVLCGVHGNGWFGVRSEPKGRGYDVGRITGNLNEGDCVCVVEDVCTTGETMLRAIDAIEKHGARVIKLFSIVDRGGLTKVSSEIGVDSIRLYTLDDFTDVK